mmetsp:Transcript_51314/g.109088  ORF Transcript_51314/g.109088 Transcript_51314/m.109088 type:complete len:714 (+) Transcript_51314:16-2157(+)
MGPRLVSVNDLEDHQVHELVQLLHALNCCSNLRGYSTIISSPTPEGVLDVQARTQMQFKVIPTCLNRVIKTLQANDFNTFDVTEVMLTTEYVPQPRQRTKGWLQYFRAISARDRLSTLEIHTAIVSASHLTFDHILLVVIACIVAAIGLLANSAVMILASFFVSPLMTMVMASTWGMVIGDRALVLRGLRNTVIGGIVGFSVSFVLGICLGFFGDLSDMESAAGHGHGLWVLFSVNSQEIISRGPPAAPNLCTNAIIAAISGVLIALGTANGISGALAGVTLAASFLPPLVNCGLTFGLGLTHPHLETNNQHERLLAIFPISGLLYLQTCLIMPPFAYLTFKAKRIGGRFLSLNRRRAQLHSVASVAAVDNDVLGPGLLAPASREGSEIRSLGLDTITSSIESRAILGPTPSWGSRTQRVRGGGTTHDRNTTSDEAPSFGDVSAGSIPTRSWERLPHSSGSSLAPRRPSRMATFAEELRTRLLESPDDFAVRRVRSCEIASESLLAHRGAMRVSRSLSAAAAAAANSAPAANAAANIANTDNTAAAASAAAAGDLHIVGWPASPALAVTPGEAQTTQQQEEKENEEEEAGREGEGEGEGGGGGGEGEEARAAACAASASSPLLGFASPAKRSETDDNNKHKESYCEGLARGLAAEKKEEEGGGAGGGRRSESQSQSQNVDSTFLEEGIGGNTATATANTSICTARADLETQRR